MQFTNASGKTEVRQGDWRTGRKCGPTWGAVSRVNRCPAAAACEGTASGLSPGHRPAGTSSPTPRREKRRQRAKRRRARPSKEARLGYAMVRECWVAPRASIFSPLLAHRYIEVQTTRTRTHGPQHLPCNTGHSRGLPKQKQHAVMPTRSLREEKARHTNSQQLSATHRKQFSRSVMPRKNVSLLSLQCTTRAYTTSRRG